MADGWRGEQDSWWCAGKWEGDVLPEVHLAASVSHVYCMGVVHILLKIPNTGLKEQRLLPCSCNLPILDLFERPAGSQRFG
jgi:hypothetical protein